MKDPQTTTSVSIIDTAPTRTTTSAIQPLEEGFRILHVMHSASAQHEFKVGFHSSGTIEPVRFEDGSLVLHAPDGTYLGDIEPPWAIDANGSPVPTRYRWEHGTLIQVVDHDPRHHRYPIVIDPKWTYGYNLTAIGAAGYPTLGVNTAMAMRELRRCFNCSFPIKGAPRSIRKPARTSTSMPGRSQEELSFLHQYVCQEQLALGSVSWRDKDISTVQDRPSASAFTTPVWRTHRCSDCLLKPLLPSIGHFSNVKSSVQRPTQLGRDSYQPLQTMRE